MDVIGESGDSTSNGTLTVGTSTIDISGNVNIYNGSGSNILDATGTFDIKMKALYKHASQVGEPNAARQERAKARYGAIGKKIGTELAEQFKLVEIFR